MSLLPHYWPKSIKGHLGGLSGIVAIEEEMVYAASYYSTKQRLREVPYAGELLGNGQEAVSAKSSSHVSVRKKSSRTLMKLVWTELCYHRIHTLTF